MLHSLPVSYGGIGIIDLGKGLETHMWIDDDPVNWLTLKHPNLVELSLSLGCSLSNIMLAANLDTSLKSFRQFWCKKYAEKTHLSSSLISYNSFHRTCLCLWTKPWCCLQVNCCFQLFQSDHQVWKQDWWQDADSSTIICMQCSNTGDAISFFCLSCYGVIVNIFI